MSDSPDCDWATKYVTLWTYAGAYISLLTANRALYIISWYTEWWVDHSFLEYVPTTIQTVMCVVTLVHQMSRCVVLFMQALRTTNDCLPTTTGYQFVWCDVDCTLDGWLCSQEPICWSTTGCAPRCSAQEYINAVKATSPANIPLKPRPLLPSRQGSRDFPSFLVSSEYLRVITENISLSLRSAWGFGATNNQNFCVVPRASRVCPQLIRPRTYREV